MANEPQPLVSNQKIVNPDGTPTQYFQRWAQERQIDISGQLTTAVVNQLIASSLAARKINTAAGSGLAGGGDLSADRSLTLNAGIDLLTDVDTTTTPPTNGQALLWNTPSSQWKPGTVAAGGGGSGGLTQISQSVVTVAAASITLASLPTTYEDLIIVIMGRGTNAAADVKIKINLNGDVGANYDYIEENRFGAASAFAQTAANIGALPGSTATASAVGTIEILLPSYARTVLHKQMTSRVNVKESLVAGGNFQEIYTDAWRSAAAINTVLLTPVLGNFDVGTIITLYGRGGTNGSQTSTLPRAARQTGRFYPGDLYTFGSGVGAIGASINLLIMRQYSRQMLMSGIACEITTLVAASNVEMALYTSHPTTGMPYQLVQGSGLISSATTGVKTFALTANYAVSETVWIGYNFSANVSIRIGTLTQAMQNQMGAASFNIASGSVAGALSTPKTVGTAWPSDLTGSAWTDNTGTGTLAVVAA